MNIERLRTGAQGISAIVLIVLGILLIPAGLWALYNHFYGDVKFRDQFLFFTFVFLLFGAGALWAGFSLRRYLRRP